MSYLNGKDALPAWLLEEVQRYVQGACIYIPRKEKKSYRRNPLTERNAEIQRKHAEGFTVRALSEEYYLSPQAIYKILSSEDQ